MSVIVPHFAISTATVIGLLAIIWLLWNKTENTLSHIRRLLLFTAIFYTVRCVDWTMQIGLFRTLTVAVASLLPLMTLLVIESFMRQHAPQWIKLLIGVGGALLMLLSLSSELTRQAGFEVVLFVFQIASFAAMIFLIFKREKSLLSDQENTNIGRIGFILIIVFPLMASDFEIFPLQIPTMMSGLAVLMGCWVLLHLHDRQMGRLRTLLQLVLLTAFALAASLFVSWYLSLDTYHTLQIWAMLFAFTMAAAVIVGAMRQRWRSGAMGSVTDGLTQSETLQSYLDGLKRRDLGCNILNNVDLSDFNADKLLNEFGTHGAIDIGDLPKYFTDDTMGQSQIRTLLKRYGGTQAYLVAKVPLHIAVGQCNNMTNGVDNELLAAFGLARLIAERDCLRKIQ